MNLDLMQAQLAQARRAAEKMAQDREVYLRLAACLAGYLVSADGTMPSVGFSVAVKRSDFDAVPGKWRVEVEAGSVKAPDDPDGAHVESVLMVRVGEKAPTNGLALPGAPRIVMPNGEA